MKTLLLLSLLFSLLIPWQDPNPSAVTAPLSVTSFKWARDRRTVDPAEVEASSPQRAMIPQNRIFQRNARANEPRGARDPNADTLDGRSAAIDKNVAESRAPQRKDMDGFAYRIKVKNDYTKQVEIVFWEYQFQDPHNPEYIARRQFLCGVNISPGKSKDLEGFSLSGPSDVVDAKTLADNPNNPFKETVVINRIEYAGGTVWQRKNWSLDQVKASYERVLREQWVPGTCKGL